MGTVQCLRSRRGTRRLNRTSACIATEPFPVGGEKTQKKTKKKTQMMSGQKSRMNPFKGIYFRLLPQRLNKQTTIAIAMNESLLQ